VGQQDRQLLRAIGRDLVDSSAQQGLEHLGRTRVIGVQRPGID
jgi:hypothetical protein